MGVVVELMCVNKHKSYYCELFIFYNPIHIDDNPKDLTRAVELNTSSFTPYSGETSTKVSINTQLHKISLWLKLPYKVAENCLTLSPGFHSNLSSTPAFLNSLTLTLVPQKARPYRLCLRSLGFVVDGSTF